MEDTGHQPTKTMVFEKKDSNEMSRKPKEVPGHSRKRVTQVKPGGLPEVSG